MILPNKRTAKDIGSEISLTIFIGNIIGNGSKNPLMYFFSPKDMIPANWITKNDNIAKEKVTKI
mgnify:CR=1 FL=1